MLRYEPQPPVKSRDQSKSVEVVKRVKLTSLAARHLREQAWESVATAANLDLIVDEARAGGMFGLLRKLWMRKAA